MRTDVKLGVVISLAIVLVAGGYYVYRDKTATPIPVGGASLADASKPATTQPAATKANKPGRPAGSHKATGNNGAGNNAKGKDKAGRNTRTANRPSGTTPKGKPVNPRTAARRGTNPKNQPKPPATRAKRGGATAPGQKVAGAKSPGAGSPATGTKRGTKQPARGTGSAAGKPAAGPARAGATRPGATGAPARTNPRAANHNARPGAPATGSGNPANRTAQRRGHRPASTPGSGTPRRLSGTGQPTPGAKPAADSVAVDTYKVQPGDTYSALAKSFYGDVKHTGFLVSANASLGDPSRLAVGTVVRIPPLPATPAAPAGETNVVRASSPQPAATGARTYTVKSGDTFYGIARSALGDANRWRELFDLNKQVVNGDATRLQVGQVITLPAS